MKYPPIFALLCLACSAFAADTQKSKLEHRSVSEAYTEPEIGIVFPAEIGPFRKQEVIRSFNPMIGTTIRYADGQGHCADIYVYALPEETVTDDVLAEHFRNVKNTILSLPSKGRRVKTAVLLSENPIVSSGRNAGYSAVFELSFSDHEPKKSILSMTSVRNRIVKLRMTCEDASAKEFSDAVLPLLIPGIR